MGPKTALAAVLAALTFAAPARATLVGWGYNRHGEIGGGFRGRAHLPVSAPAFLSGAIQIVSTFEDSYALMPDGTVLAWGDNGYGQLGDGDRVTQTVPVQVKGLTGVRQIAASGATAMALLSDGRVATWGGNTWGTLGIGTNGGGSGFLRYSSTVPVFPDIQGAVAIFSGGADHAVLLGNGTVLAWGENSHGQLGDGTTTLKDLPIPVPGLSNVRTLAIGGSSSHGGHLLALLNDGTVRALGENIHGELGDGTTEDRHSPVRVAALSNVAAVSASIDHSMAILNDGSVTTWGADTDGQLGVKANHRCRLASTCVLLPARTGLKGTAISAGTRYSLVLSGGQVLAFGDNEMLQLGAPGPSRATPEAVPGLGGVTSIAAGEFHSLALGTFG